MPYPTHDGAPGGSRTNPTVPNVPQARGPVEDLRSSNPTSILAEYLLRSRKITAHVRARTNAVGTWSAQVEEDLAAAHEFAARLYEQWLQNQHPRDAGELAQRAAAHRERAAESRSLHRLAEQTMAGFEAQAVRSEQPRAKDRKLALLASQAELRALISRRIDQLVADSRGEGATWAEIAEALHVTRQTAHERYRSNGRRGH